MATWATRNAFRGKGAGTGPWGTPDTTPPSSSPGSPTTSSPWSEDTLELPNTPGDPAMEDSGFSDWLEVQLGATGDMSVVERLQYLLDTGQFADLNVRVGQGNNIAVFKAHRLLLATASQPLYKLVHQVNPHPGPNEMTTIRITDMKPADFKHILRYIYTDTIDCKNINVAFELLRASRKWGLAGLGIKSLTFLEEFIDNFVPSTDDSKDNLFDLLVLSEDTLGEMSDKCWQVVLKNSDNLIPCEGYLNLDMKMVQKLLCHKDLKIESQLKLFEAIRDWGLRYVQERNLGLNKLGDVVEELIKVVDFEKISDADFLSTVLTSECLGKAEVIAFFMTHGLEIPRNLDFNNNKQLPFWLCLCATSNQEKGLTTRKTSKTSSSSSSSNLSTVNEALSKICSLTQNGSVLEFNKVCRFRKGYRCPVKEIYQEHEVRFRVDKNIKLLGVSFGFLFSATDMGINVHCQGPWETRQWTDITQSYCRVSGEKQEVADVRLMFLQPVRIEANQSYKVLVKTVRMSQGSSEVELWGGTGGLYCVENEDAAFHFIKAAVDPTMGVEESDGDTKPGVIHELLYKIDTDEPEKPVSYIPRRRRTETQEEEKSPTQTSNPWRHRPDSLKVPETPVQRKRSPTDDYKLPEAPPFSRRRESNDTIPRKTSADDYLPSSFSTNRWRTTRKREDAETERKKSTEEYLPSSFSTNRWRTTLKDKTDDEADRKKSVEEYRPSSFATNRWSATQKEDKKDTPFGNRAIKKAEDVKTAANHPFVRKRESNDTTTEIPFYMRKTSQDGNKGTTTGLGRTRFGAGSTTDTSIGSRYLRPDGSTSATNPIRSTGTASLLASRFSRESSLTRPRESSLSRFGSGSSYVSRYDKDSTDSPYDSSSADISNKYSSSSSAAPSDNRYASTTVRYSNDTPSGKSTNNNDDSTTSSSRYGKNYDSTTSKYGTDSTSSSKYGTETSSGTPRQLRKYGTTTTSSGSNLAALRSNARENARRYGTTNTAGSAGNLAALASRPDSTTSSRYRSGDTTSDTSRYSSTPSSAKYGSSLPTRYTSPAPTGSSTSRTGTSYSAGSGSRYGSSAGSTSSGYGSTGKYSTSTPATRVTSRGAGVSPYTSSNRYTSPASSASKYSSAGRYS